MANLKHHLLLNTIIRTASTDKYTKRTGGQHHLCDEAKHEPTSEFVCHVSVEGGRQLTLLELNGVDERVVCLDAVIVSRSVVPGKGHITLVCIAVVDCAIVNLVWVR